MSDNGRLFIVNVEDHEINMRSYIIRATSEDEAMALQAGGQYMFESKPELVELLKSDITDVSEILTGECVADVVAQVLDGD